MDSSTLTTIGDLLAHGGNIGILIAVFIVGRASARLTSAATKALETLEEIKDSLNASRLDTRVFAHKATSKLNAMHTDIERLPLQVAKARGA